MWKSCSELSHPIDTNIFKNKTTSNYFLKSRFDIMDVEYHQQLSNKYDAINNSFDNGEGTQLKSPWDIICRIINCKVAFRKQCNGRKYIFIQLAGHVGRFKPGDREGYILKLMDDCELDCYNRLKDDYLKAYVPEIGRSLYDPTDGNIYTELQDLLYGFRNPSIMDVKIGIRTFLEDEYTSEKDLKPRADLYVRLLELAPNELTAEEHQLNAITKRRYMTWREQSTCSSTLGFRIQAMKKNHVSDKEFYRVKEKKEVKAHFKAFADNSVMKKYLKRLNDLKAALQQSEFFRTHELIGSSLLFVHDSVNANIWLIDFGKTRLLPDTIKITHNSEWIDGNHEDGYLIGINNLIEIFQESIQE